MHIEIHPIFVHFPIALIVVVLCLDAGRWIFDREELLKSGFWSGTTPLLILALLGAALAVITGLDAETGVVKSPAIHDLVEAHELAAFITSGLLATLTFWRVSLRGAFPQRAGIVYLLVLLLTAVVVGYGAYFGSLLVYSHGVGVDRPL